MSISNVLNFPNFFYFQLSEADFRDSVLTIGFSQEQQNILSKFYESKQKEITDILSKLALKEPHYHDLDWRFEIQVINILFKRILLFHLFRLLLDRCCIKQRPF